MTLDDLGIKLLRFVLPVTSRIADWQLIHSVNEKLPVLKFQILHCVKNRYQFFTFGKCEICVWSISIILGV